MISKNAQNILFLTKKIVTRRSNDPSGTNSYGGTVSEFRSLNLDPIDALKVLE